MAKQTINIGTVPNDGTGDQLRTALTKANENFTELYDGKQPIDADLTAIAALSTTAYGRSLLTAPDAAGVKPALSLVKGDVGLGNVDNTADTAKPVSTAQQTALNLKANLASPTFTGTVAGITKAMVGLGNVDNTADAAKPVSTAQQAALDLKASLASPALTGTPTAPTAAPGTNTTQVATTAFVLANAVGGASGDSLFPGYTPGRYLTTVQDGTIATGQNGINSVWFAPFFIFAPVTISELGVRLFTGAAGGLYTAGIYANLDGKPTGLPLVSVVNQSAEVSGIFSAACTPALIPAGMYWAAFHTNNAGVTAAGPTRNAITAMANMVGASSPAELFSNTTEAALYLAAARTYDNTMPNVTSLTFTASTFARGAALIFRVQP